MTAITQKPMAHNAAGDFGNSTATAEAPLPRPLPLLLPLALTRCSWTFGIRSASPHGTVFSSLPWNIASVFDDTTVTESDGGQWKGVSGQQCARSLMPKRAGSRRSKQSLKQFRSMQKIRRILGCAIRAATSATYFRARLAMAVRDGRTWTGLCTNTSKTRSVNSILESADKCV